MRLFGNISGTKPSAMTEMGNYNKPFYRTIFESIFNTFKKRSHLFEKEPPPVRGRNANDLMADKEMPYG